MPGCRQRLGLLTLGLITQLAARRLSGCDGRRRSQLVWSHYGSLLERFKSVVGIGPLCPSENLKNRQIVYHFCTAKDHNVSYQELKDLLESKAIWLIDVREKWEIAEHGKIPGSINMPLGEVVEALQMDPVHFKEKYSQDMPAKSDHVVFSCLAGVRSNQALAAAKSLGFSRVQQYPGGFSEWLEYESSKKK